MLLVLLLLKGKSHFKTGFHRIEDCCYVAHDLLVIVIASYERLKRVKDLAMFVLHLLAPLSVKSQILTSR